MGLAPAQLILHSGHNQSLQAICLEIYPSHWHANNNQGSTTMGGCTQPTWKGGIWSARWKDVPLDPTELLLHKASLPRPSSNM